MDLEQATRALLEAADEVLLDPERRVSIAGSDTDCAILQTAIDNLRAALAESGWRPIETAPMDGTRILGYRAGKYAEAFRVQRDDCEMWQFGTVSGDAELYPECKPTYWRPLPEPPGVTESPRAEHEGRVSVPIDSIALERYRVVRTAFWWRVAIGDGQQTVGRCYSETEAQQLAAALCSAFLDGAFLAAAQEGS